MQKDSIEIIQRSVCLLHKCDYCPSPNDLKAGVAFNVKTEMMPINGMRHNPAGDTTGWYIWAGEEFSEEPDFFKPLHIKHLFEWCPMAIKYLGLPPGWRFLVTNDYEDVWFDERLLVE